MQVMLEASRVTWTWGPCPCTQMSRAPATHSREREGAAARAARRTRPLPGTAGTRAAETRLRTEISFPLSPHSRWSAELQAKLRHSLSAPPSLLTPQPWI